MGSTARTLIVVAAAVAAIGSVSAEAWSGGQALAAAGTGRATPGQITTVAGGIGGPGPGRDVAVVPCDILQVGRRVLFTDTKGMLRHLDSLTGRVSTVAGSASGTSSGDGGTASKANFVNPCGLAADTAGDVAVAEDGGVRLIAARTGTLFGKAMSEGHIYTVAGIVNCCSVASNGVVFDHAGNLVLVDGNQHEATVVAARSGTFYGQPMIAGDTYVIAGTGNPGFSGDGGPATAAMLGYPSGVAVDASGDVLIADTYNYRVRMVAEHTGRFYGIAMTAGDIYTIAGQHYGGWYGDGGPATIAELCNPQGLAFDHAGNLLIADACNGRIRAVAPRAGRFYGRAMKAGYIYSVADGLASPTGVAVDDAGNLLIADQGSNRVWVVAERSGRFYGRHMTAAHIYSVAGNGYRETSGLGGPPTAAELGNPQDIASGPDGVAVIVNGPEVTAVRLVAGKSGSFFGQKMAKGDLYSIAGGGSGQLTNGGPATGAMSPAGMAADANGNVLIADQSSNRVWVVAAQTGRFYGRPMTAGRIYAIAGTGTQGSSGIGGWPRKAELEDLAGVALDRFGDVVITEFTPQYLQSVCRVLLVAAATGRLYGVNMKAGHIYQVAGAASAGNGPSGWVALNAKLSATKVRTDQSGNLLLVEPSNNKIRVVARTGGTYYGMAMAAGHEYVVAGDGASGFSGDDGPATQAELGPAAVAVDAAGNLLIADQGNNRIRVVADRNGTFYGMPMTAGDIYTIAGDGTGGFAGDGGPATGAELNGPAGLTAVGAGVLVADTGNSRLRLVAG